MLFCYSIFAAFALLYFSVFNQFIQNFQKLAAIFPGNLKDNRQLLNFHRHILLILHQIFQNLFPLL